MSNSESPESQSGQYLLGMLVMQDVQLGILIALLPAFGDSNDSTDQAIILTTFLILLKTIASFIIVMGKWKKVFSQRKSVIVHSTKTWSKLRRMLCAISLLGRPVCSIDSTILEGSRVAWSDLDYVGYATDNTVAWHFNGIGLFLGWFFNCLRNAKFKA